MLILELEELQNYEVPTIIPGCRPLKMCKNKTDQFSPKSAYHFLKITPNGLLFSDILIYAYSTIIIREVLQLKYKITVDNCDRHAKNQPPSPTIVNCHGVRKLTPMY